MEQELDYWARQLRGFPPVQVLPSGCARPAQADLEAGREYLQLPEPLVAELKDLGRQQSVTLFMIGLAAFQVVLHCQTGEEDMVLGTDVANRNHLGVEALIGFFINQLVLRTDLSGNPDFREILARVRRTTLEAYAHQDMPFNKLVEKLLGGQDPAVHPLFQRKFTLRNQSENGDIDIPGLVQEPIALGSAVAKLDLQLDLVEVNGTLAGFFEYRKDLFERAIIVRLIRHFEVVLHQVTRDVHTSLVDLKETIARTEKEYRRQELQRLRQRGFKRVRKDRAEKPEVS